MAIIATNEGGGDFKSLDAGSYIARCISVWDIGSQFDDRYNKWKPQAIIRWEVPEEQDDEGKPLTISAFYSLYLSERANLYKALVAWRGRRFTDDELARFDVATVLDAPCMLTVEHTPNGKQKVAAVAKLPKGTKCPPAVHALEVYEIGKDPHNEQYQKLPEWVRAQINKSRQFAEPPEDGEDNSRPPAPEPAKDAGGYGVDDSDDLPF